jgi:hypothetical protein
LKFASEGFAVPDCRIEAQGGQHLLTALAFRFPHSRAEFTNSFKVTVGSEIVERTLKEFIESVITRLDQKGVQSTPLHAAWDQIMNHAPEEAIFCKAAATLGFDPYGVDESTEQEIIDAYLRVSEASFWEIVAASPATDLLSDVREFDFARKMIKTSFVSSELSEFKSTHAIEPTGSAPWERGYKRAKEFRRFLKVDGALPEQDVWNLFGLREPVDSPELTWSHWMDALVEVGEQTEVGLALQRSGIENTRFRLCRCAYEYLSSVEKSPRLVTRGRTKNQAENRAFAAELLVPASELKEKLAGKDFSKEDIEAISGEYGVSTYVVEHQIDNHGLATYAR